MTDDCWTRREINTIFTPIVMSACGAMGPSMVFFFKEVYGRAKGADKFLMSQQIPR